MEVKTIYYTDELNDEFADQILEPKRIDENYKYIYKNPWKAFTRFFWLRIVAWPIANIYLKLKFRHKYVNKKILKKYKKQGYFLYGNHTHNLCDAVIPSIMNGWKGTYVIVNPANLSIPYLGKVTPSLGAIPLPDTKEATKNFINCIEYRLKKKKCIAIYPEAHIWPFYTKIRPFRNTSFRYPIEYETPVFCFTNVYTKRGKKNKPKMTTYVDGPFFPNKELSKPQQRQDLRDQVYNQMVERSKLSNLELIKYVKKEEQND